MTSYTNESKNTTSTFRNILKHGKDTVLRELENILFTDVVFEDGRELKDITFAELTEIVWANEARNTSSTFTNETRNT